VNQNSKSRLFRLRDFLLDLLPTGGIGADGPPPDIDGRHGTDSDYRRAVLTAKSQMSSGGQATTSYEPVDRGNVRDG
jgi:hypothetical protein